jgi:hypothetical protein
MLEKLRRKLIKLLGGFTDDDVLAEAMSDLFNVINADDILQEAGPGKWKLGNRVIEPAIQQLLVAEAQTFLKTRLWKDVLQYDVKYNANLRMFERSKTEMDMVSGKMCFYVLDIFKTRLESLAKGEGRFNSRAN